MILEEAVIQKLKGIKDPHTNTSIYDMNLVSDLKIDGGSVSLTFTPTSSFCPMGIQLAGAIKKGLRGIEGVREVSVTVRGHIQERQLNEMLKSM